MFVRAVHCFDSMETMNRITKYANVTIFLFGVYIKWKINISKRIKNMFRIDFFRNMPFCEVSRGSLGHTHESTYIYVCTHNPIIRKGMSYRYWAKPWLRAWWTKLRPKIHCLWNISRETKSNISLYLTVSTLVHLWQIDSSFVIKWVKFSL